MTTAPLIGCFQDIDGSNEYYLFVEKEVLCGNVSSFCKSLAMWFSLHYIFNMEHDKHMSVTLAFSVRNLFLGSLPPPKKSWTYHIVMSDIQNFTVAGLLNLWTILAHHK